MCNFLNLADRPRVPLSVPPNRLPAHPRTSVSHPMALFQTAMTEDPIHRSVQSKPALLLNSRSCPTQPRRLSARRTYPSMATDPWNGSQILNYIYHRLVSDTRGQT
ncbi:hypothetical protein HETIRDRAFT_479667 [Heterobasidion irregulare TC 32-1]|uniref:Uncharacterized protein n=1 Tax=Heterobasidion irregulare (strain TC 32-1) TaxID=747525 RepID=W4JTX2_HETIT|nr:uncharacterized protein HETIRDRAFT_479667 [Heterobasidion irregulare TC 32-1]ETW77012.1 hypothetical protein HETIRDRAFT_479667 [Heterobasidion irregulare TC 32-1]